MKKQVFNPYLPTYEYIPDGEPKVFGDRLYVYGSHDRAGGDAYCQNDYVCWSTPIDDLSDWRYEGVIFKKVQEPLYNGENISNLYAPDVVQGTDGKFYLYYSMENSEVMSVAVCDTPAGAYQFLGHVHDASGYELGSKDGDWIQFDPGVLVDDDGRVYLYSGFNPFFPFKEYRTFVGAYVVELAQDMVTAIAKPKVIIPRHDDSFKGHDFFEASSIRKIGDTYYFVYSSQQCHELCYATSRYPDKNFKFGGTLISNMDLYYNGNLEALNHGGNDHGGMVCVKGQWYIFYHRPTNQTMFSRQGSAEPITIAADGSIAQAEMTSCGLNGGPLEGKGYYEAGIACNLFHALAPQICTPGAFGGGQRDESGAPYLTQDGEDREEAPGTYVTNIKDGYCLGFKYFKVQSLKSLSVSVRGQGSGCIEIYTKRGGEPIAIVDIASSSDGTDWKTYTARATATDGVFPLYFVFRGDGSIDMKGFELA